MPKKTTRNILIIGPDRESQGGVAAHIQKLKNIPIFKNASVFDVGSRGANLKSSNSSYFQIFSSFFKLRKMTKQTEYHILINASIYVSSFVKLLLILMFIDRKKTSKIDVFYHGGRFDNNFSSFKKKFFFLTKYLDKVDTHYFLSDIQKEGFHEKIGNYPSAIFNNYADENQILDKITEDINTMSFLFVGRIVPSKGIYEILEAANILKNKDIDNFKFNIVGDGPHFSEINELIDRMDLTNHISMLGFRAGNELKELYRKAEWFVLPTYHMEGFPYVFIESMQAGTPVLSTPNAALSRLIKPNNNGDFIEPKNSPMLADKLEFIIKNRPNLSQNCYDFFRKNLSANEANDFYTKVISN